MQFECLSVQLDIQQKYSIIYSKVLIVFSTHTNIYDHISNIIFVVGGNEHFQLQ